MGGDGFTVRRVVRPPLIHFDMKQNRCAERNGYDLSAIRSEIDGIDRLTVFHFADQLSGYRFPKTHDPIAACCEEPAAVGTKFHMIDEARVTERG